MPTTTTSTKPSLFRRAVTGALSVTWMTAGSAAIHTVQLLTLVAWPVLPRRAYRAAVDHTQVAFIELVMVMHGLLAPGTVIEIELDESVDDLAQRLVRAREQPHDYDRSVVISNHLTLLDWIYLWFVAYLAGHGAALKIILKESPKYVPIIGPGMMFFRFIFLKRQWAKDEPRLRRAVADLAKDRDRPLWLLVFPEGTILTENTIGISDRYSAKSGIPRPPHTLLPRSTGLYTILSTMRDHEPNAATHIYDVTLGYAGFDATHLPSQLYHPRDVYTGAPHPPTVTVSTRRIAVPDLADREVFDEWLRTVFRRKSAWLARQYQLEGSAAVDEVELAAPKKVVRMPVRVGVPWRLVSCVAVSSAVVAGLYAAWQGGFAVVPDWTDVVDQWARFVAV